MFSGYNRSLQKPGRGKFRKIQADTDSCVRPSNLLGTSCRVPQPTPLLLSLGIVCSGLGFLRLPHDSHTGTESYLTSSKHLAGLICNTCPKRKGRRLMELQLKKLLLPKIFLEPLVGRGLETPEISVCLGHKTFQINKAQLIVQKLFLQNEICFRKLGLRLLLISWQQNTNACDVLPLILASTEYVVYNLPSYIISFKLFL